MYVLPQRGEIAISPQFAGPARVRRATCENGIVRVEAIALDGERYYDRHFVPDEFAIKHPTFTADATQFWLAMAARFLSHAPQYGAQLALGAARIDPLPHQIDAVYNHFLATPRTRYLLADDPGAGKTIMAGLLIKELGYRNAADRVLIVVPAGLRQQWQSEMRDKFHEEFEIIEGKNFPAQIDAAFWQRHPRAIISYDLAKRDARQETLKGVPWDVVVVDEAHKMSAFGYESGAIKTKGYRLGELLSEQTHHLLLMTATPHRGRADTFTNLRRLLDPNLLNATSESDASNCYTPMIRRLKEELVDFAGKPLYTDRNVDTVGYSINGLEKQLYEEMQKYVHYSYKRAEQLNDIQRRNNHALYLLVLQRRHASSLQAIRITLERRLTRIEAAQQGRQDIATSPLTAPVDIEEDERDEESKLQQRDDERIDTILTGWSETTVQAEEKHLRVLVNLAKRAEAEAGKTGGERKLGELQRLLNDPFKDGKTFRETGERLLVFTENRDTLNYLRERFREWKYAVATIHGGMNQQQRRGQIEAFREDNGPRVMIATDAAGEGINLQFCRLMVNYDLPWNPNRLEQRMGRIHRYGQKNNVYIYNLASTDTAEGRVLTVLYEKLEQMRHDLGSDLVYDVIGDVLSEADLQALMEQAIRDQLTLTQIRAFAEAKITPSLERVQEEIVQQRMFAKDVMSTNWIHSVRDAKESAAARREGIERLVKGVVVNALAAMEGGQGGSPTIQKDANTGTWTIERVPRRLRSIAPNVKDHYTRLVFHGAQHKEDDRTELVSLTHPLFIALLRHVSATYNDTLLDGTHFSLPIVTAEMCLLHETVVSDRTGHEAAHWLTAVQQHPDGTFSETDLLTTLLQAKVSVENGKREVFTIPSCDAAENWARARIQQPRLAALQAEYRKRADAQDEYMWASLGPRIAQQRQKVRQYETLSTGGTRFDLTLSNARQELETLERQLDGGLAKNDVLRSIGANPPHMIAAFVAAPLGVVPVIETARQREAIAKVSVTADVAPNTISPQTEIAVKAHPKQQGKRQRVGSRGVLLTSSFEPVASKRRDIRRMWRGKHVAAILTPPAPTPVIPRQRKQLGERGMLLVVRPIAAVPPRPAVRKSLGRGILRVMPLNSTSRFSSEPSPIAPPGFPTLVTLRAATTNHAEVTEIVAQRPSPAPPGVLMWPFAPPGIPVALFSISAAPH